MATAERAEGQKKSRAGRGGPEQGSWERHGMRGKAVVPLQNPLPLTLFVLYNTEGESTFKYPQDGW